MQPVPARWDVTSGRPVTRIEVWSRGSQVAVVTDAEINDGVVSEKWVTGVRRTLSLSVPPTGDWLSWFKLPRLELRPYKGLRWGSTEHLCPLGRFPILPPAISLPRANISVSANDYWQFVIDGDFAFDGLPAGPGTLYSGLVRDAAGYLLEEVMAAANTGYHVEVTATSTTAMPATVIDKSRTQTIIDWCEQIGAEAFFRADGRPVVQNRFGQAGAPLTDDSVVTISSSVDTSKVFNVVSVSSSNNQTPFYPVVLGITDPNHPANQALSNLGPKVLRYSSPFLTNPDQGLQTAVALLQQRSAPALSWSVSCVPDPSREAGDLITVSTGLGAVYASIQEVTHPLTSKNQTITLGAA